MPRLKIVDPETAEGKAKELLDTVKAKYGMVPNIAAGMANSPAVLDAYLSMGAAMQNTKISAKLREQIALATAQLNGCNYCLAAHTAIGKMVGLEDQTMIDARKMTAPDDKDAAAVQFARVLVEKRGFADDDDLEAVRAAGYGDGEIAEIIATVIVNTFTNYFNHVAETPVDFPEPPALT